MRYERGGGHALSGGGVASLILKEGLDPLTASRMRSA
jgi:hypothetical protein